MNQSSQPRFAVFGAVCLQQGFSGTQMHVEVLQQQSLYSNKSYADKAHFIVYEIVREVTHSQWQTLVNPTPGAIVLYLLAFILAVLIGVVMRLKPQGTVAYASCYKMH